MQNYDIYNFSLILEGVDEKTEGLEDTLYEAGCDDALINYRNGVVYLDFDREAENLEDAVLSAISDIESSTVNARVVSVAPDDYVNESEIAKRLALKRQTVSLWVKGERRANFPKPVMRLTAKSPLWRWYDVVTWLYDQSKIEDKQIIDDAKFIESINIALITRDDAVRKYQRQLIKKLPTYSSQNRGSARH